MTPTLPQSELLTQDDLAAWSGYAPEQTVRIREWLDENGIRYKIGRGGRVCTTLAALNQGILRQTGEVEFV